MATSMIPQPQMLNNRLRLDLSNMGLTSIPTEVFDIIDLEVLNVSNNQLSSIPEAIGRLRKLYRLDADNNLLTSLPRAMVSLQRLRHLYIHDNTLTEVPPVVCSLSNLEVLSVARNPIRRLPDEITQLTKITTLDIHSCQFDEFPRQVLQLKTMMKLYAGDCKFYMIPDEIMNLEHLWFLHLSLNLLRTLPTTISHLIKLWEVNLSKNRFETFPEILCELPALEKLDISKNQIIRLPNSLHRSSNLKDLDVTGNPLAYPPTDVCTKGTSPIIAFLKEEANKDSKDSNRGHGSGAIGGQKADDLLSRYPSVTTDNKFPIVDFGRLEKQSILGRGGFANVIKARHLDWRQDVAVKCLLTCKLEGSEQEVLYSEARKLNLGNRSDYVISLLGVCLEPHLAIVMPYMENGSLAGLLRDVDVPWALRWRMAHEISLGMTFLHCQNPQILHCDLKAENVLLDGDFHVKISDFGLSKWKTKSRVVTKTSPEGGTITHAPPEYFKDINVVPTTEFDVYSFGVLLWEIVTRKDPYGNAANSALIRLAVMSGQRPDMTLVPTNLPDVDIVSQLMQACWSQNPEDRPSYQDCEDHVRAVSKRTSKEDILQAIIEVQKIKASNN
ncbi:uncharacterized protein [Branchiostoma lanceolatum]|uniref:uncharacterized protein n=1 Tax=Branchiostoma lanceolatum TaxID=7740 RepID=UPI003452A9FD